jgi:hypothetical protein
MPALRNFLAAVAETMALNVGMESCLSDVRFHVSCTRRDLTQYEELADNRYLETILHIKDHFFPRGSTE